MIGSVLLSSGSPHHTTGSKFADCDRVPAVHPIPWAPVHVTRLRAGPRIRERRDAARMNRPVSRRDCAKPKKESKKRASRRPQPFRPCARWSGRPRGGSGAGGGQQSQTRVCCLPYSRKSCGSRTSSSPGAAPDGFPLLSAFLPMSAGGFAPTSVGEVGTLYNDYSVPAVDSIRSGITQLRVMR